MGVKREMEIEISSEGKVSIHVKGVAGKECLEFSRFLEEALGEVVEQERTSEYYMEEIPVMDTDTIRRRSP
jgi:hypothetical protein